MILSLPPHLRLYPFELGGKVDLWWYKRYHEAVDRSNSAMDPPMAPPIVAMFRLSESDCGVLAWETAKGEFDVDVDMQDAGIIYVGPAVPLESGRSSSKTSSEAITGSVKGKGNEICYEVQSACSRTSWITWISQVPLHRTRTLAH